MIPASRVVCFLPARNGGESAPTEPMTAWGERAGMACLRATPYVVLADAETGQARNDEPALVLNLDPGKLRGPRATRVQAIDITDPHSAAAPAAEIYNLLILGRDSLVVESDRLGLKPLYWAEAQGGLALANRILDLIALLPNLLAPIDTIALKEMLAFGHPLGERTLHARIRRFPAGAALRWCGGQVRIDRRRRIKAPPIEQRLSIGEAADQVAHRLEASVRARSGGHPVLLGLTGGFDSRNLLGACQAAGIACEAITYGERHHAEAKVARAVARRAGVAHRVMPISPRNVRDNISRNLRAIEATA